MKKKKHIMIQYANGCKRLITIQYAKYNKVITVRFPVPKILQSVGDFQKVIIKNNTLEAQIKLGKQEIVSSCSKKLQKKS